jgi:hypothetical protein
MHLLHHPIFFITLGSFQLQAMEKDFRITSAKQYEDTMIAIFEMQEQEEPLTAKQQADMEIMAEAAQRYEDEEL